MSDTLIIGGGIIGLLTARELAAAGLRVTLIERGETGREASWAGGGILSPLYPWRCPEALSVLARWSQRNYPRLCDEFAEASGIDPELTVNGLLILDAEERDQVLAWALHQGTEVQLIPGARLREEVPELLARPPAALLLPAVANVRNPRLLQAARRALDGRIRLRQDEEVLEILSADGRVTGVRTSRGLIPAERVVVSAGAWTARLLERITDHTEHRPDIEPVRGQMLLFAARPGQVRYTTLCRDAYLIPRRDGRVLAGSTLERVGFAKDITSEAREGLYRAAIELYPSLAQAPIEAQWAGLRPASPNGIPYVGPHPELRGLYVNAGHFRNGLVTGPASARLLADLILGREPITDPAPYALTAAR